MSESDKKPPSPPQPPSQKQRPSPQSPNNGTERTGKLVYDAAPINKPTPPPSNKGK